jgi:hypothetical protein
VCAARSVTIHLLDGVREERETTRRDSKRRYDASSRCLLSNTYISDLVTLTMLSDILDTTAVNGI